MLRWVSIAPFETPVVPPVYWRNARSSPASSAVSAATAALRPAFSASSQRIAPSMRNGGTSFLTRRTMKFTSTFLGKLSMSPRPVTMTRSTSVSSMHSSSTCPKFSSTTIARAPESTSWWRSSRTVYSGFVLTTTSPARSAPTRATGYCSTFGIIRAMRSPLPSPALARYPVKSFASRSSSAKVTRTPRFSNAGRSGKRAIASSMMATRDGYSSASISCGVPSV